MSYIRAEFILPKELLELVQEYADGQYLYIPRKIGKHRSWGDNTDTRQLISRRDRELYQKYIQGVCMSELANEYYLSLKSIQRIIRNEKRSELS
jgi:Mor family transcriptional regulator